LLHGRVSLEAPPKKEYIPLPSPCRGGLGRGLTPQLIDHQYPGKSQGVGKRLTELAQTDFNLGNSSTYIQVESALFGIFPSQNDENGFWTAIGHNAVAIITFD